MEKGHILGLYIPIRMLTSNVTINVYPIGTRLILDNLEKYEGGPVALQVIGRRFEEKKVLDILEIISQTIGKVE